MALSSILQHETHASDHRPAPGTLPCPWHPQGVPLLCYGSAVFSSIVVAPLVGARGDGGTLVLAACLPKAIMNTMKPNTRMLKRLMVRSIRIAARDTLVALLVPELKSAIMAIMPPSTNPIPPPVKGTAVRSASPSAMKIAAAMM